MTEERLYRPDSRRPRCRPQAFVTPILFSDFSRCYRQQAPFQRSLLADPALARHGQRLVFDLYASEEPLSFLPWTSAVDVSVEYSPAGTASVHRLLSNATGLVRLSLVACLDSSGAGPDFPAELAARLKHLRALSLDVKNGRAIQRRDLLAAFGQLGQDKGPVNLTSFSLEVTNKDYPALPLPELAQFLSRFGQTLRFLRLQHPSPPQLHLLCPSLLSLHQDCIPDSFFTDGHPTLRIITLELPIDGERDELRHGQSLWNLRALLKSTSDRTLFPSFAVIRLWIDHPRWRPFFGGLTPFASECEEVGVTLQDYKGVAWFERPEWKLRNQGR